MKLLTLIATLVAGSAFALDAPEVRCQRSANYFAEFYQGLYTMHRHGLEKFPVDSPDRQLYFVQVQKNGEKIEMNVIKSVRGDTSLSASEQAVVVKLHQALGKQLRETAALDAQAAQPKDKAAVLLALQEACP